MSCITIDCGTTNTRIYLVTAQRQVLDKETRHMGVRNTAMSGNSTLLLENLREMIAALRVRNPDAEPISAILSSGMITSEIGLKELPHIPAPCGLVELAEGLTQIQELSLTEDPIPVYFVRGVKNASRIPKEAAFSRMNELDFMRGEETQIMGLMRKGGLNHPSTVLILSSHSKFIPVENGKILGSLTTASGQAYAAILDSTFVGKSVRSDGVELEPEGYFDANIVKAAASAVQEGGLVRCMMYPRFQDVLLETKWYERKLFFEACVAVDDMMAVGGLNRFGNNLKKHFCLIGQPERCRLYTYILGELFPESTVSCISDTQDVDQLSIDGIFAVAEKAGIVLN